MPRPLTAILLLSLLFHAGWAGGPKKLCGFVAAKPLVVELASLAWQPQIDTNLREAARAGGFDLCSHNSV